jgi:2-polyprenyl-6-methoxyphenol hydroxylase-like FAD-dependent oxidoreductase
LGGQLLACGARVDRLLGCVGETGRSVLDVRYSALGRQAGFGVGIHRAALFAMLHDAVTAAGLALETGRMIVGSRSGPGGRYLRFEDGEEAGGFDLVVDALGSRTPLSPPTGRSLEYGALWASLDWPEGAGFDDSALEQRYRAASVMVGVLPIGASPGRATRQLALFWSLRADRLAAWRAAGLDRWKAQALELWPMLAPILAQIEDADQLTFARYAHRTLATPGETAMIHIGDSWHSASPQLGQGANMALMDAYALALALRREADVDSAIGSAIALRRRHVRLYQAMTALLTPVYQSDSRVLPFLRDRLVGPLSKYWPVPRIQAAMVSGLIGDPLTPLGLSAGQRS